MVATRKEALDTVPGDPRLIGIKKMHNPEAIDPNLVDSLQGGLRLPRRNRHGVYELDVFSEDEFLRNKEALTELVIVFAQRELGWSEASARTVYEKALKVENPEDESKIPSVLVYRKSVLAGISAQRLKAVYTPVAGVLPVHYHILRAFEEPFRGVGMGRDSVADTRLLHRRARYYAARNGGPVPVWATMQTGREQNIFEPGTSHPWDRFYDQDENDRVYQQLMGQLHMDIRTNGEWPSGKTGVSKKDYPEYNKSYQPRLGHKPTEDLLERMTGENTDEGQLGMDIEGRDSVVTIIKFRDYQ